MRRDARERQPGRYAIGMAALLLLLLAAGLFLVSVAAQYQYLLPARHNEALPAKILAGALDALMITFSLLAFGLSRASKGALVERMLIMMCGLASAGMNLAEANLGSPRSVAAYVVAPIALAVTVDRLISVVFRFYTDRPERSAWAGIGHAAGRVALYLLALILSPWPTATGLRRIALAAAPVPDKDAVVSSHGTLHLVSSHPVIPPAAVVSSHPAAPFIPRRAFIPLGDVSSHTGEDRFIPPWGESFHPTPEPVVSSHDAEPVVSSHTGETVVSSQPPTPSHAVVSPVPPVIPPVVSPSSQQASSGPSLHASHDDDEEPGGAPLVSSHLAPPPEISPEPVSSQPTAPVISSHDVVSSQPAAPVSSQTVVSSQPPGSFHPTGPDLVSSHDGAPVVSSQPPGRPDVSSHGPADVSSQPGSSQSDRIRLMIVKIADDTSRPTSEVLPREVAEALWPDLPNAELVKRASRVKTVMNRDAAKRTTAEAT